MTIGGLFLGAAGAAIFVVLLNYVIQPQMSVETRGIYVVRDDRFNVWYHDGSPERARYTELKERLEESLDDLLGKLDVSLLDIPLPIDVLVHDDAGQLQSSIVQRKSPTATHTFFAVVDLLAGEDPYSRLAELVLAFGWGECFSQLLYEGTRMVITHVGRNHHAAFAAAPPRLRYTFEDLVRLEAAGQFQPTLYQRFDSPFSASMALGSLDSIATFHRVFAEEGALVPREGRSSLQAASLVEYLVECNGGLDAVRSVWGPGSSLALFDQLACGPVEQLSESWWSAADEGGQRGPEYDYYRGLLLLQSGKFDEAHRLATEWMEREVDAEELAVAVRSALCVGAFDVAKEWLARSSTGDDRLRRAVELFDGWNRAEADGVVVFGARSEEEFSRVLNEVRIVRTRIADGLALDDEQLPETMTIFFYEDPDAREIGEEITSDLGTSQTAWHVVSGEDLGWVFATTLPTYAYRIMSASNLLRVGVAAALTYETADLVALGCEHLEAGRWPSSSRLSLGETNSLEARIETGLMVQYLLDEHGPELIRDLWYLTARSGGGRSLDRALSETVGMTVQEIETKLLSDVLDCE